MAGQGKELCRSRRRALHSGDDFSLWTAFLGCVLTSTWPLGGRNTCKGNHTSLFHRGPENKRQSFGYEVVILSLKRQVYNGLKAPTERRVMKTGATTLSFSFSSAVTGTRAHGGKLLISSSRLKPAQNHLGCHPRELAIAPPSRQSWPRQPQVASTCNLTKGRQARMLVLQTTGTMQQSQIWLNDAQAHMHLPRPQSMTFTWKAGSGV